MTQSGLLSEEGDDKLGQRVARIEAVIPHLATKAWVLGGVLGGMAVAAGLAMAIAKLLP